MLSYLSAQARGLAWDGSNNRSYFSPMCHYWKILRFFETEGIAALTMLVSRYKITVKDEPEFAHETFDERRERLLRNNSVLTTTYVQACLTSFHLVLTRVNRTCRPIRVPLVFTRRSWTSAAADGPYPHWYHLSEPIRVRVTKLSAWIHSSHFHPFWSTWYALRI
jgi:hypothetical protein